MLAAQTGRGFFRWWLYGSLLSLAALLGVCAKTVRHRNAAIFPFRRLFDDLVGERSPCSGDQGSSRVTTTVILVAPIREVRFARAMSGTPRKCRQWDGGHSGSGAKT